MYKVGHSQDSSGWVYMWGMEICMLSKLCLSECAMPHSGDLMHIQWSQLNAFSVVKSTYSYNFTNLSSNITKFGTNVDFSNINIYIYMYFVVVFCQIDEHNNSSAVVIKVNSADYWLSIHHVPTSNTSMERSFKYLHNGTCLILICGILRKLLTNMR